jgi:hypothetical protein
MCGEISGRSGIFHLSCVYSPTRMGQSPSILGTSIVYKPWSHKSKRRPSFLLIWYRSPEVRVETYHALTAVQDTWVMFNDFVVRGVSEDEVFSFPDAWKVSRYLRFKLKKLDPGNYHTGTGRPRGISLVETTDTAQPGRAVQGRLIGMESS